MAKDGDFDVNFDWRAGMKTRKLNSDRVSKKAQIKLDHRENCDIDGVTRRNGKIVIPSNVEIKKGDHGKRREV